MPMPADDIHGFDGSFEAAKRQLGHTRRASLPRSILALRLECDDKGRPHANVVNAITILAHDPALAALLAYNEFAEEPQILRAPPPADPGDTPFAGPYPRQIHKADIVALAAYIQRAHLPRIGVQTVEDAVLAVAFRSRFHPVRAWLDSLRWDGVPRLDTWLVTAFGAADTPYTRAVGAKVLIAAVRRIRQPGCKFDTMPILEGPQGVGKSRCLRRLFGEEWFTDSMPPDLKSKDGMMAALGVWCVEFAEIEHLIRTDPETMKAVLSRPVERFRPPYGKGFLRRPRQCVFIGTTNVSDYLRDVTGNRRIWPIACQHADEPWVAAHREQLWAEAAAREAAGEIVWLEEDASEEAKRLQDDRMEDDPWREPIREYLLGRTRVTTPEILAKALEMPTSQQNRGAQMRVARVLVALGWRGARNEHGRWWEPRKDDIG